MPRIADYSAITDGKFTLSTSGDIDFDRDFTLESGAGLGSSSILAFVLFVDPGAASLTFEVAVNGSPQLSYGYNGPHHSTLHEVISGNVLKAGTNNVSFRITGGTGNLSFGDVVLFYQRDI